MADRNEQKKTGSRCESRLFSLLCSALLPGNIGLGCIALRPFALAVCTKHSYNDQ